MKEVLIKLLEKWACSHDWDQYHRTNVYEDDNTETPYKIKETLICKKCGKIKKIEL